jgi:hypothetical protein
MFSLSGHLARKVGCPFLLKRIMTDLPTKPNSYIPSVELRKYVSCLFHDDILGDKSLAMKMSGVDRGRFYYNMKKPEFRKWFSDECDKFFENNNDIAATALIKKVRGGDVQAIRTFYELRGKLKQIGVSIEQHTHIAYVRERAESDNPLRASELPARY